MTATVRWRASVPSGSELRSIKQSALYHAAAQAFLKNGYHGTTLDDIAAALGVKKATLYYYVRNKQELLVQCHMAASDATEEIPGRIPKVGLSGLQKLELALHDYLESLLGEESSNLIVIEESALTPENYTKVIARRDEFQALLMGYVREGLVDGSVAPCDPKLALFAILGGINWTQKWYRSDGPWSVRKIADGIVKQMIRSIAAKPDKALPA